MPTKIQLRRDTAADWTSNNPTLSAGEFGWESDTNRFKIGDGSAAWASLAYADTLKTLGDILVNGSTISAPSNGDLTLTTSGTGNINLGEFIVNGTTLSSSDSSSININEGLIVDGTLNASGQATLSGLAYPTSDGSANQFLKTDGSGALSFADLSIGDLTIIGSTISTPSNADLILTPGGTGDVVAGSLTFNGTTISAADSSKVTIGEALDVTGATTLSGLAYPTSDGSAGQVLQTDGSGTLSFATVSIGDLSIVGSSILSPSSADLTLNSSNGNVVIEGIKVAGTTLSTEDSTPGIEIAGNLIPSQNGVFQLGSSTRRWQTLYVAAETIDLGGATIKSDGSGQLEIAATGATLPSGSKVGDQTLVLGGKTDKTGARPVQIVKIFVSDGSTNKSDAQFLAGTANLELEFNGTVEDVPVYTEANQGFELTDGTSLATNAGGATLFQF